MAEEFVNPHQVVVTSPYDGKINCTGCSYIAITGKFPGMSDVAIDKIVRRIFNEHAEQYTPGRAPDIQVEYELSASCSVCDDGGDMFQDSSDSVECRDCGTTWYADGTNGELDEDREIPVEQEQE